MSMRIVYTLRSQEDLKNIYEYIAFTLSAPGTAKDMYLRLTQAVRSLEQMPGRNPLYKDEPWRSQGLRFLPVKKYLILYTTDAETVTVVRILYGGMDVSRQLEEETE